MGRIPSTSSRVKKALKFSNSEMFWILASAHSTPTMLPISAICVFLTGASRIRMKAYTRRDSKCCGSRDWMPASSFSIRPMQ